MALGLDTGATSEAIRNSTVKSVGPLPHPSSLLAVAAGFSFPLARGALRKGRIYFGKIGVLAKFFIDGLLQRGRGFDGIALVRFDKEEFACGPLQA